DVEQVFKYAKNYFTQIVLGCMQPRGEYRKRLQRIISRYTDFVVKPVDRQYSHYNCCSFYTD
ncbi:MAG: radical SAM protein, partial [Fervidobacterium pennivorans]